MKRKILYNGKKRIAAMILSTALSLSMLMPNVSYAEELANPAEQVVETETQNSDSPQLLASDINAPVIESVEVFQNGQALVNGTTFRKGDTLEVKVQAYDADSSIEFVQMSLVYYDEGNNWLDSPSISVEYSEEQNKFIGTWVAENTLECNVAVREIMAVDTSQNYSKANVVAEESGDYLYWFRVEDTMERVKATNVNFVNNGQTFNQEDVNSQIDFQFQTEFAMPYATAILYFEAEDGSHEYRLHFNADEEGKTFVFSYDNWSWSPSEAVSYKYILDHAVLYVDGYEKILEFDKPETYSFTVNWPEKEVVPDKEFAIDSLQVSHNGQVVEPGTDVKITLKLKDNSKVCDTIRLTMRAAAEIYDAYEYLELVYDETIKGYVGTFSVTEDTYPCEWYIDGMNGYDASGSHNYYYFSSEGYPYYVNVMNDGTFVSSTGNLTVDISALGEDVQWTNLYNKNFDNVERRVSLKDLGIQLPTPANIEGLKFMGWQDENGNLITEDTLLLNDSYWSIKAKYDKMVASYSLSYVNQEGNWDFETPVLFLEKGTTIREYVKMINEYVPGDITKDYAFEKWEFDNEFYHQEENFDQEIHSESDIPYTSVVSKYKDVNMLRIQRVYYNEDGARAEWVEEFKALAVKQNVSNDEVKKKLNDMQLPDFYPGLRFVSWDYEFPGESGTLKNGDWVSMYAKYENYIVRYFIEPNNMEDEGVEEIDWWTYPVYCQVAEKGETVKKPATIDGLKDIVWKSVTDNEIVVEKHLDVWGSATVTDASLFEPKEDVGSEPETKPEQKPDENQKPATNPPSELPKGQVDYLVGVISKAEEGENITIEMGSATVVPVEILQSLKGKDVSVTLNMGGYSWTINGKDISATDLKSINLEVKFDTNAVPSSTVKALAGDNPVKQISLTHNGDFGFKATLTMNMGSEYKGKYGNLYYHDSNGKLVFMNAGLIGEDGNVNLSFSHASDYVIVVSDAPMGGVSSPSDNVDTGDNTNVVPYAVLLIVCGAVVLAFLRKKKNG